MKLETEGIEIISIEKQTTGLWDMAFIWFCANVAVPRLMMGGSLMSLGFSKAAFLLLWGNILVILPLLAVGIIGHKVRVPTMAATRMTFGIKGSYVPAFANGISLFGWAANITVISGFSINAIISTITGFDNVLLWILFTGIVQLLITAFGFRAITWLQRVSMPLLALLSIYSLYMLINKFGWSNLVSVASNNPIPLMLGLDILAANAFAWGPMVCDYTRYSKNPASASWGTLIGSVTGAAGFMFVGLVSGIATGSPNPVAMLVESGMSTPMLIILAFVLAIAGITTNVMNIYSSSISFVNVFPKAKPWKIIGVVGIIVTGIALIPNLIGYFINFLIIVGSIFVPLIAIMLVDFFLLKKQDVDPEQLLVTNSGSRYWYNNGFNLRAIIIWVLGAVFYNVLPFIAPSLGSTLPCFIIVAVAYFAVEKAAGNK